MVCQCLSYFARLNKLGSVNAKPVHKFMLAMKSPSSESFKKAIEACGEAGMIHLEAMAREQYAKTLYAEKNEVLANEYITSSYWLYQDWGAHAKALHMSEQYPVLKVSPFNHMSILQFCTGDSHIDSPHVYHVVTELCEKEIKECYCKCNRECYYHRSFPGGFVLV